MMVRKIRQRFMHDIRNPILRWGYIFVLPGLISYLLFTFYPTLRALAQSFYLIRGANNPWVFNGFGNYLDIFKDMIFWGSLKNTFMYVFMTIPAGTIISLLLATVLNSIVKGRGFFRALYFMGKYVGQKNLPAFHSGYTKSHFAMGLYLCIAGADFLPSFYLLPDTQGPGAVLLSNPWGQ